MAKLDAKNEVAAAKAYGIGKSSLPVMDVPVDTTETVVHVSRSGVPDLGRSTPVLKIEQYFSFDGGNTWDFGGASEHAGGANPHWSGKNSDTFYLGLSNLPGPKNPGRKIRIEITPYAPMSVKVDFEPRSGKVKKV